MLDEYLASIVPGIKQADKETKFLQGRVLDAVGPIAFMYEHLNDLLSHAKENGEVVLSSEQVQALFSASSHGLRGLVGNASALMVKERRSTVLKKINAKGSLVSLASETFPDAKKNLFGDGFEERRKTRSETAKTLLQAKAKVISRFFVDAPLLSNSEGDEELVPLGTPSTTVHSEVGPVSEGGQPEAGVPPCINLNSQAPASRGPISASPRYAF